MPWPTPSLEQIRGGILRDIVGVRPKDDITEGSDHWVRANAMASAILGLYQHQEWLSRQILEDSCDEDILVRRAARFGLKYKLAGQASGMLRFVGQAGAVVPIYTEARRADGVAYQTQESGEIPAGGVLDVSARAVTAGVAGNAEAGLVVTLVSAPNRVQNVATVLAMTGGDDKETSEGLLQRLLRRMQSPPQGGADHDYVAWVEAVAGVRFGTVAVYHERRNYRSVDVVFRAVGGLPSVQLIDDAQAAIDANRPPTADAMAVGLTPVAVNVAVKVKISGVTLAMVESAASLALEEYFDSLQPGESAIRSRIGSIIQDVSGVIDVDLLTPAANVPAPVDGAGIRICVFGALNISLMP